MDFCRICPPFFAKQKNPPFLLCASEAQRKERNGGDAIFPRSGKSQRGDGAFWKTAKRSDKTRAAK